MRRMYGYKLSMTTDTVEMLFIAATYTYIIEQQYNFEEIEHAIAAIFFNLTSTSLLNDLYRLVSKIVHLIAIMAAYI